MLNSNIQLPKYQTINTYSLMFPTLASMFMDEYIENSDRLEMFLGKFRKSYDASYSPIWYESYDIVLINF